MERYRISNDGAVCFVTMSIVDWLPVFVSEPACRILSDSLNFCHQRKGPRINAYVIMPTHFHAISTTILVARGFSGGWNIGGFRRRPIGCLRGSWRMTSF